MRGMKAGKQMATIVLSGALSLAGCASAPASSSAPAAPTSAAPVSATSTLPADRAEAIDEMFTDLEELGIFNGAVLIDIGGEIVFQRNYGRANYELDVPFNDRTLFRIASISKPMTDAALGAMIVNGQLRLDTRVSDYLPAYPRGRDITIEMLVNHTSGIPHPNDTAWGDGSRPMTLDQIVDQLARMPLDFEPGARTQYSNGGFAVLTKIMEIASGESYPQFMQRLVFDPLGMRDTGVFGDSRAALPNMSAGYEPGLSFGSRRRPRPYFPEARPGGGSIYASAADVMTFARATFRGGLPGSDRFPDLFGSPDQTVGITGRAPGYFSYVYQRAPERVIVVLLSNNYAWPAGAAENAAGLALGEPTQFPAPEADFTRVAPTDSAWIGRWSYPAGRQVVELSIRRDAEGRLIVDTPFDSSYALPPMVDGGYVEPMFGKRCHMRAADRDRIDCRPFGETGFTMELSRRP